MVTEWIWIKSFRISSIAHIYQNRLRNEGIECILENDLIGTVLPYPNIDIDLKVRSHQVEEAQKLMAVIEEELTNLEIHDFREADEKDIEFERRLFESKKNENSGYGYIILVIIFFIVILYFLNKNS